MNILLRQATIVEPSSPFHLKKADILISNGLIASIELQISSDADKELDCSGAFVSPGWIDIFAHFCDPGLEQRETLETGAAAAAAGGFTDVFLIPNTNPVIHSKSTVEYIRQKSRNLPVHLHPLGSVTKNTEGKELSEMYDMHQSGAVAFSDGINSIQSPGLMMKALLYLKAIDKTIIQLPDDRTINPNGLMNEGLVSTMLGLPGRPALAEELSLARDIELAAYTDSKIHFTGITTKGSVDLVRKAKKQGLHVSCSTTPYHLLFTDEDLKEYDTNLKLNPPLRTNEDREALRKAVLDGTIDCITAHHLPQDTDHKLSEFEYAQPGMTGLQTMLPALLKAMPELETAKLVELLSTNARSIFTSGHTTLAKGSDALLTIFDTSRSWTFNRKNNRSRSINSVFMDEEMKGAVLGIVSKGDLILNKL